MVARAKGAFMTHTVIGAPDTCAQKIAAFLQDCALDGLMLIFADYAEGLRVSGTRNLAAPAEVMSALKDWIAPVAHRAFAGGHAGGFRVARWRAWRRQGYDVTAPQAAIRNAALLGRCGARGAACPACSCA